MDAETLKVLADIGLGGLSLFLISRQMKVSAALQALVADHEDRITTLEVRRSKRRRKA